MRMELSAEVFHSAAQAAVADDLPDGVEPLDLADFDTQVSAVTWPMAGIVINRSTRAASSGSASSERSRARSVYTCRRCVGGRASGSETVPR